MGVAARVSGKMMEPFLNGKIGDWSNSTEVRVFILHAVNIGYKPSTTMYYPSMLGVISEHRFSSKSQALSGVVPKSLQVVKFVF